jgi:multisubunit Na+/H+ antiporter MnhE subunit
MKFLAFIAQSLLWLTVAASPTLAGVIIGFILSMQAGDLYSLTVPFCGIVGFILGGFWAERIRKTIGLSTFLGRLTGMRELRDSDKNN